MFQLNKEAVKLSHLNVRSELHGEEEVPAVDLKFERVGGNAILDDIAPGLRTALYRAGTAGDQTDLLNGAADGLVALAFPGIEMPLKLDGDYPGYALDIDTDLGVQDTLKLRGVFKKNRVTALAGGSSKHEFTVSTNPDAEQIGRLYAVLNKEVSLTLTPPAPALQRDAGDEEE